MSKLYRAHLDYETFSELDLPDVGTDRYAQHESTEVLMAAYCVGDEEVEHWDNMHDPIPASLLRILNDPNCIIYAWNAPFERYITKHVLGIDIPIHRWRDTMVMSLYNGLPGSLDKAGPVIGLPETMRKDARGKALITKFSKPRKPTKRNPADRLYPYMAESDWHDFCVYNVQDVITERAIYKRLKPYDLPREEWEMWIIDQQINQAGIPINMEMVDGANATYEYVLDQRVGEMREITGLANPGSTTQLLPWLQERGYPFEDCKKGHIQRGRERADEAIKLGKPLTAQNLLAGEVSSRAVSFPETQDLHRVLELRSEVSRTSPTKYAALQRAVDRKDGVLRNTLQFCGASRTHRWAGRIFQPQNLAKPPKDLEDWVDAIAHYLEFMEPWAIDQIFERPMDVLATGVRPAAQAPEGYLFVDADLNAIENRVLGWVSNCSRILQVFELGRDPYIDFATYLFGEPYDVLYHEYKVLKNGAKRTVAKPGVLGCGYQLGAGDERVNRQTGEIEATGLLGYAWNMGIKDFTKEQAILSVKVFRETYSEVVDFWYGIERAAKACVKTGKPVNFGLISFEMKGPFLRMILPSGNWLAYLRPRIEDAETPWGEMKATLTYEGVNDKNQWTRIKTHGGKLTENAVQSIARDLLAHGIKLAMKAGIDVRLHVHDQIVALAKAEEADETLDMLQAFMQIIPWWARSRLGFTDLPLGSAGFTSKVFKKD